MMPGHTFTAHQSISSQFCFEQARFNLERKSWAERVERIEKISSDSKQDAKNAGDEVSRLQRAYQDIFSKSRAEKETISKELQICEEETADLRQRLHAVQEVCFVPKSHTDRRIPSTAKDTRKGHCGCGAFDVSGTIQECLSTRS